MTMEFKLVDTRTLAGLKQAERLKARGWQIGTVGLFSIDFYREEIPRRRLVLRQRKLHQLCLLLDDLRGGE